MNKKIILGLVMLSVVVIGLIYIFMDKEPVYALSVDDALGVVANDALLVKEAEFKEFISNGNAKSLFVDIRTPEAFVKGHIADAYNMPTNSILSEENLDILKELKEKKIPVILYGETRRDANAPWMILQQLGFSNIRILEGGYTGTLLPDSLKQVSAEMPALNYAEAAKPKVAVASEPAEAKSAKKAVKVAPVKKEAAAEGGC